MSNLAPNTGAANFFAGIMAHCATPHVGTVETASGTRYAWGGNVHPALKYRRADGQPISEKEARGIAKFGAIGGVHVSRTFATVAEAHAAANA